MLIFIIIIIKMSILFSFLTFLKLAMMELKVVLAIILLNFNIDSTKTREELRPSPGLVLQPSAGIKVNLTSRQD